MTREEQMVRLVQELRQAVPELHGIMIASVDGLPIAHELNEEEATRIAAMASAALGLGKRIVRTLELGVPEEITIKGGDGYFIMYGVGDKAVLAFRAPSEANLGLVRLEARTFARKAAEILK